MANKTRANRIVGISEKTEVDWQTEEDLRTLQRAKEIEKDPKRLKRVQDLAKQKLQDMAEISVEAGEGKDK